MSDNSHSAWSPQPADRSRDSDLVTADDSVRKLPVSLPSDVADIYRPGKFTPDRAAHLIVAGVTLGAAPILAVLGITVMGIPALAVSALYTTVGLANLYYGFRPVPESQG